MRVSFSSAFAKQYRKLTGVQQAAVDGALLRFRNDPADSALRNHALNGKLKGLRSLKAGYDLRIIFEEEGGYVVVILLQVGTHDEVY